jgi:O-antigen/teichoic acid export membrane protein
MAAQIDFRVLRVLYQLTALLRPGPGPGILAAAQKHDQRMIRVSRFLKDLFSTGFSQVAVILFGVVLLKLLAAGFTKDDFGLFNVVRRWDMVLLPLLTLNMSIGLARYVSYEQEKATFFLHLSMAVTLVFCLVFFPALFIFPATFSILLFKTPNHSQLVMILTLFVLANLLHLLAYSYFRGKLNMNAANLMRTLFFGFPLIPAVLVLAFKTKNQFAPVSYLYLFFLAYALWGVFISLFFLRKEFSISQLTAIFMKGRESVKEALHQGKSVLTFSLSRIPGVFFSAMVFSFPVLYASHRISLTAAGYIGIVVVVLRLFEVFSMPFNMIFLPKFSTLKREHDSRHITEYSQIVLNFIFTFLPFCGVIMFGLIPFVVYIWFGSTYLIAADSVALAVLFSVFYLAFALIRGILDGLFEFPYTNIISFSGFLTIAVLSIIFGQDTYSLAVAFGCGLVMLGLVSIYLMVKKVGLTIRWHVPIASITGAALVFLLLHYADAYMADLGLEGLHTFVIGLFYRLVLVGGLWLLYWRRTVWYKEVVKRVRR